MGGTKFYQGLTDAVFNHGHAVDYRIRRSQRAQRARIIVTATAVEVVVPANMPERVVHGFVRDKRDWIDRTRNKLGQRFAKLTGFAPQAYCNGAAIPFRGETFPLSIESGRLKRVKIEFDQGFYAILPPGLPVSEQSEAVRQALIAWMKKTALLEAQKHVDKHSEQMRLYPRTVRVKNQKTRWGSCGIHNDINLNWLLILAPPGVFEYVVVHELCHIRVRNHSADFWSLVAKFCPDYKAQKAWLNEQGANLMLGL